MNNRSTQVKHASHYFLLAALLVMLACTGIFWSGVIGNALGAVEGAAHNIDGLTSYLSCVYPNVNMLGYCMQIPFGDNGPTYYLNTMALVVIVCIFLPPFGPYKTDVETFR